MPKQSKLTSVQTADYKPRGGLGRWYASKVSSTRVPFSLHYVPMMLEDPRIQLGLWMIKGPLLAHAKFFVDSEDKEVQEFVVRNLSRFWLTSASKALCALQWGFQPAESVYRVSQENPQHVDFDALWPITYPLDVKSTLEYKGRLYGFRLRDKEKPIEGMKAFWHVHWPEFNKTTGRSRLFASFPPWIEKWCEGGYRDSRRLFVHKQAFDGGTGYYPPGTTSVNGVERDNEELLREVMDKKTTGGVTTLPKQRDGNRIYEIEPPVVSELPATLLQYGNDLNDEELEGMAVLPEVAKAQESGSGFAGRRVPQQAFFAILQELLNGLLSDVDNQILRPLVAWNFGQGRQYEVIPFGLLKETADKPATSEPTSLREEGDQQQPQGGVNQPQAFSLPEGLQNPSGQVRVKHPGVYYVEAA